MATYYSSPGDGEPPTYRQEGEVPPYHIPPVVGNFLYMGNSSAGQYPEFTGIIQNQQGCLEQPGHSGGAFSKGSSKRDPDMVATHSGPPQYGSGKDMRADMLMQLVEGQQHGGDIDQSGHHGTVELQQFSFLNGHGSSLEQPDGGLFMRGQGLSLSLNTQVLVPSYPYWSVKPESSLAMNSYQEGGGDHQRKIMHSDVSRTIRNSKFLRAAQDLLDEVVNVWKSIKQRTQKSSGAAECKDGEEGTSNQPESDSTPAKELPPAEKQELQNKLGKLLAMVDEVDRRYKHYYHQMQIIVSSFDVVVGAGSAKPYTAVALQTISRHFRCLKDAINDQIRSIRKKLGEEEASGKEGRLTRLRYIDQQLRQQRAFQQYGMVQQNAWRPQRGLPENSVSILRAWLFEHFLHPYPKDSEKLMLARQTGLTRSQISNWFINARVRLWKPMIEDMYKEELGDMEMESNSSSDNAPRKKDRAAAGAAASPGPANDEESKGSSFHAQYPGALAEHRTSGTHDVGLNVGTPICFQSDAAVDDGFMSLMMKAPQPNVPGSALFQETAAHHADGSARFMSTMSYQQQMMEMGRYGKGSVSLTLGLQHPGGGAGGGFAMPNVQQGFPGAGGGDEAVYNAASVEYDAMEQLDQRQRFEPPPLLHDFVA